jgi:hypothetical protein
MVVLCGPIIRLAGVVEPHTSALTKGDFYFRAGCMDQRTRMIAVLSCLAVSMTGTAGLLAWMDPFAVPPEPIPESELMELARAAVADEVPIDPGRWSGISVFGAPSSGGFLSATWDLDSHFVVDLNGRFSRARSWVAQQVFDVTPKAVRIQVTQASNDTGVSALQWASTRALVRALLETIPLDPDAAFLSLDPELKVQQAQLDLRPARPLYLAG